jgi:uncharacterized protein (DUF1330 family)
METPRESPLKKYKRQPKLYIDLPSKGKYSESGVLLNDVYTQLAVFSMTPSDEILFKTPDALINGEATAANIKSCIPSIVNPWGIATIDIDTILIGIRMATYGTSMSVNATCPHCKEKNTYDIDLQNLINYYAGLNYRDTIQIDNFKIKLKPLTYKQLTENQKRSVQYSRAIQIQAANIKDEEEKNKFVDDILQKIAAHGINIIFDTIESVEVDGQVETDRSEIMEFMSGNDVHIFKKVKAHIESNSIFWRAPTQKVSCGIEECGKEHKINISLDQSDFFGLG